MRLLFPRARRCALAAALAATALAPAARSQSCELETRRLEIDQSAFGIFDGDLGHELLFSASPQACWASAGELHLPPGVRPFAEVISNEPSAYHLESPFRGVVRLGDRDYGFALDSSEDGQGYDRLHFDLNGDGDLANDEAIEALEQPADVGFFFGGDSSYHDFPAVDLVIEVDGEPLDYAFSFSSSSFEGDGESYVNASLQAAVYRQGTLELAGAERQVVLVDQNSNGRFDDHFRIEEGAELAGGPFAQQPGDLLFVDPQEIDLEQVFFREEALRGHRHLLSKLVLIDAEFFELRVAPSGQRLQLEPCELPLGRVENKSAPWNATVYGELGVVQLASGPDGRAHLPEGDWRLLSYSIDRTEESDEPEEESSAEGGIFGLLGGSVEFPETTRVSARAPADYRPVQVAADSAVALPFGPPYRPVVHVEEGVEVGRVELVLSIVGTAGEVLDSMTIEGGEPDDPRFLITDAEGEVVLRDEFEFG